MKYGIWKVSQVDRQGVMALGEAGISPLAAAVLVSRGYDTEEKARAFLAAGRRELHDPMELPDMEKAAARVKRAVIPSTS